MILYIRGGNMEKAYHINKEGVPGPCNAVKGKCPFGEHYSTYNEAENAANRAHSKKHGVLNTVEKPWNTEFAEEYNARVAELTDENRSLQFLGGDSRFKYKTIKDITDIEVPGPHLCRRLEEDEDCEPTGYTHHSGKERQLRRAMIDEFVGERGEIVDSILLYRNDKRPGKFPQMVIHNIYENGEVEALDYLDRRVVTSFMLNQGGLANMYASINEEPPAELLKRVKLNDLAALSDVGSFPWMMSMLPDFNYMKPILKKYGRKKLIAMMMASGDSYLPPGGRNKRNYKKDTSRAKFIVDVIEGKIPENSPRFVALREKVLQELTLEHGQSVGSNAGKVNTDELNVIGKHFNYVYVKNISDATRKSQDRMNVARELMMREIANKVMMSDNPSLEEIERQIKIFKGRSFGDNYYPIEAFDNIEWNKLFEEEVNENELMREIFYRIKNYKK